MTVELASAAVPIVLLDATLSAATAFAASGSAAAIAGMVSASAASLAEGVATTMMITKIKVIGGVMLAGALTMGIGGATARQFGVGGTPAQDGTPEAKRRENIKRTGVQFAKEDIAYTENLLKTVREQQAKLEKLATEYEAKLEQERDTLRKLTSQTDDPKVKKAIEVNLKAAQDANARRDNADQGGGGFGEGTGIGSRGNPGGPGLGGGMGGGGMGGMPGMMGGGGMGGGMMGGGGMGGSAPAPPGLVSMSTSELVVVHKPKVARSTRTAPNRASGRLIRSLKELKSSRSRRVA